MMQMAMKQSRLNSCEVVDDCLILVSSFKPAKILKFGTSRLNLSCLLLESYAQSADNSFLIDRLQLRGKLSHHSSGIGNDTFASLFVDSEL